MNKKEAYEILGITDEQISLEEIKSFYASKYNALQVQANNASSPETQNLFYDKLDKLTKAYQFLEAENLPSSAPVMTIKNNLDKAAPHNKAIGHQNSKSSGSKSIMIFFIVTLISIASSIYFGLSMKSKVEELKKVQSQFDTFKAETRVFNSNKNILKNKDFVIKNAGNELFRVYQFKVWYFENDTGKLISYPQGQELKVLDQIVNPGQSFDYRQYKGTEAVFPGKVVFYQIQFANQQGVPKSFAGVWPDRELQIAPF